MSTPLDLNRYIKLISSRALSKKNAQAWYMSVKQAAPSGTPTSVATLDEKGVQHDVRMVHRHTGNGHEYLIPLTRDLASREIEKIVAAAAEVVSVQTFDIETNETKLVADDCGEMPLDAAKHVALCTALSKYRHEAWMRERSDAGWRYGTKYSPKTKTHPLLRPWDQLPERYRAPDLDWPQKLVSMLSDYGYAMIHKEDLDRLLVPSRD